MPTVNGKKYSYTKKGKEEAKQASVNKTKIVVVPRTRKSIPVPSHEELMEGRKKLKPYRPKPKPKPKKKPNPKKKNLLYKGNPIEKRKRSRPA
jgi:hypothetical protein